METRCIMVVAEKMAAIKLQVVHQVLWILALELKAISIRCGVIFKSSILTINLSMWIELGFRKEKEIMNKDDDDFVCVRSDSCIYNMPPEYCCKDVACVLPCPQCMCGRKQTDLLNRTFAN